MTRFPPEKQLDSCDAIVVIMIVRSTAKMRFEGLSCVYRNLVLLSKFFFQINHIVIFLSPFSRYQLFLQCWLENPHERPSFTDICSNLETYLEHLAGSVSMVL